MARLVIWVAIGPIMTSLERFDKQSVIQLIFSKTNCPTLRIPHFRMHFHEWKILYSDSNLTDLFFLRVQLKINQHCPENSLVPKIAWYLGQSWPSSPTHICGTWGDDIKALIMRHSIHQCAADSTTLGAWYTGAVMGLNCSNFKHSLLNITHQTSATNTCMWRLPSIHQTENPVFTPDVHWYYTKVTYHHNVRARPLSRQEV